MSSQAIVHENLDYKCFKRCDAAAILFLALSQNRDGSFYDKDPSRSLFPMPLLSALSAPCSSSPHSPVGPYFSVETVSGLLIGFLTSRPFLQISLNYLG